MLSDEELRVRMTQNAKKRMREFEPRHMAQKWVHVAKSALQI